MSSELPASVIEASLTARNDVSELQRLNEFVADFLARTGVPPSFAGDFELVLEEVFMNVVLYGHPQGGRHEIAVRMASTDGLVTLAVEDDGIPFNPLNAEPVDITAPLEERSIGGMGIHLVKAIMDDIEYTRDGDRNRLVMRKKVR